jgi:hypothetical protein
MTQTPAGTGFVSWVLTQTLLAVRKFFEMNLALEAAEGRLPLQTVLFPQPV